MVPNTHSLCHNFAQFHASVEDNERERSEHISQNRRRQQSLVRPPRMAAAPLFRAGALYLMVLPAQRSQPPPELHERTWEHTENAPAATGAIPRSALRPRRVLEPLLQHVVVPVRRRIGRRHAVEHSGPQGLKELEEVCHL